MSDQELEEKSGKVNAETKRQSVSGKPANLALRRLLVNGALAAIVVFAIFAGLDLAKDGAFRHLGSAISSIVPTSGTLYKAFSNMDGNAKCMRTENAKLIKEVTLKKCSVNNASAIYGWFEYEHDESMCGEFASRGRSREKMYAIFREVGDGTIRMAWRGEELKGALEETWVGMWGCSLN